MQGTQQLRARWTPLVAAALAAMLLGQPAAAQDATKKKDTVKAAPKNKANLLTRDELRRCMDEQDRLQQSRTKVEQEQAALDKQKAEVLAMDGELQAKIAAHDAANEAARKDLEDFAAKRDQAADAYNGRLAGLREQGKAFDTGRQAWLERCGGKDFNEMDEAAIKKERQQAARAKK